MFLRLSLLLIVLTACTSLQDPGVQRFQATGIDGAYSAQRVVSDHPNFILIGRVFILQQGNVTTYSAEVGQIRISRQPRLRVDDAWQDGDVVAFVPTGRREPYCTGPTICPGFSTGLFPFTASDFVNALDTGLTASLLGPDGRVEVVFPPSMFAEARDTARASGIPVPFAPIARTEARAHEGG